jgi:oligosaccharide 4-alpha-D-glucosyltransferase
MQKWLLLSLLVLSQLVLRAQVTISPEKPTSEDLITLTFHADQGNAGLAGYEGAIYAHTGVITNQSTHGGDWRYVVADWTENREALKLERVGPDTYQLQFTIKELYDVPGTEAVLGLAFVFRNEDGSRVGKASGEKDIFYFFGEAPEFETSEPEILDRSLTPTVGWIDDATLYEVNWRQYSEAGNIAGFAKHLDRLQELGVKVLWLMPVHPIGKKNRKGPLGSYYSVQDYRGVNPELGTTAEMKALIEQCHEKGFKVILDWVANHTAWDHAWVTEHPHWYERDGEGQIIAPNGWEDVAQLDFDQEGLRAAMIADMRYWVEEMDIDGFRCDVAGMVPVDFWEAARAELNEVKPIWMLAEDENQAWLLNRAFNTNYGWHLHHVMNEIAKGNQPASAIFTYFEKWDQRFPKGAYPMQFITNHDENSWNGTVQERMGEGGEAFAVLSFTVPGIPLIYSGQEVGLNKRLEFFERDPIAWEPSSLEDFYGKLTELKKEYSALWNGQSGGPIRKIEHDQPENVVAFSRTHGKSRVVTIINLSGETKEVNLQTQHLPGTYTSYFTEEEVKLQAVHKLSLPPWGYRVYVTQDAVTDRQFLGAELLENGLKVATTDGDYHFYTYPNGSVEVTFTASGETNPPAHAIAEGQTPELGEYKEDLVRLYYSMGDLQMILEKEDCTVRYEYKGEPLLAEAGGYFAQDNLAGFRFQLEKEEKLLGGGERVLGMDRRGHRLKLYNQPSYGYETEADLMYYSLPIVLSSKKYMLAFDNGATGFLDLGATEPDVLSFEAVGGRMSYLVVAAETWPELAEGFTDLTGRYPMAPRWSLGNIASRMGYHSQAEVEMVVDKYEAFEIPLDGVVLDIYWFGPTLKQTLGNLDWYRDSFPEPERMMADFREKGVKTVLITEPFVIRDTKKYPEVIEQELVGTTATGEPYHFDFYFGNTTLLDIFKPETQDWYWNIYRNLTQQGVGGWWGDLGEPEVHPDDMVHVNGLGKEVHNLYGHIWAKTIYDGYAVDFPEERPTILMRSGFVGSQRYGMIPWSGDVNRTWGGLKPQVEIGLSMGLQGLAWMHSDLGGFAGDNQDAELYTRWLQYGVFQPMFRTHAQEEVPAEPIFWDPVTRDRAREAIELRYQLLPYNYTLLYENAKYGWPMMRPLWYVEDNMELFENTATYMWGDAFLVSPVVDPGLTTQQVYLPAGHRWVDFWTKEQYEGGKEIEVAITPARIPVFVKAGSFVPLAPVFQSTDDYSTENLTIHYYHDPEIEETEGWIYDDDGWTRGALKNEQYQLIELEAEQERKGLELEVELEGGEFKGQPEARNLTFVVYGLEKSPKKVKVNGKRLKSGWRWNTDSNSLEFTVELEADEVEILIR